MTNNLLKFLRNLSCYIFSCYTSVHLLSFFSIILEYFYGVHFITNYPILVCKFSNVLRIYLVCFLLFPFHFSSYIVLWNLFILCSAYHKQLDLSRQILKFTENLPRLFCLVSLTFLFYFLLFRFTTSTSSQANLR